MSTIKQRLAKLTSYQLEKGYECIVWMTRYYLDKEKCMNRCVFCIRLGCNSCPWLLIEKKWCGEFVGELFGDSFFSVSALRMSKPKEWVEVRLKQLERWRKCYAVEIRRREEVK